MLIDASCTFRPDGRTDVVHACSHLASVCRSFGVKPWLHYHFLSQEPSTVVSNHHQRLSFWWRRGALASQGQFSYCLMWTDSQSPPRTVHSNSLPHCLFSTFLWLCSPPKYSERWVLPSAGWWMSAVSGQTSVFHSWINKLSCRLAFSSGMFISNIQTQSSEVTGFPAKCFFSFFFVTRVAKEKRLNLVVVKKLQWPDFPLSWSRFSLIVAKIYFYLFIYFLCQPQLRMTTSEVRLKRLLINWRKIHKSITFWKILAWLWVVTHLAAAHLIMPPHFWLRSFNELHRLYLAFHLMR